MPWLRCAQAWGCVAHADYLAKQKQAEQETQEGIDSLGLEAAKPAGEDRILSCEGCASNDEILGSCLSFLCQAICIKVLHVRWTLRGICSWRTCAQMLPPCAAQLLRICWTTLTLGRALREGTASSLACFQVSLL